ncbi:MAG: hypothetical protein IT360_15685 [Gemmatimonadaceae bacterium]|nr:hypothetical protein [Gemmatimonadaceae bacterium]
MAQGTLIPVPFTGFDDDGDPVPGGKLYTYAAGTSTPLATYSDAALTVANANPVVLDAAGRATIFAQPTSYKLTLKNASDVELWTRDNVVAYAPYSVDDTIDGVAGESLAANSIAYLSDGTGGRTAGRWYLADADTAAYSTGPISIGVVPTQILIGATGSIRIGGRATGLSGLTAGTTYYVSGTAGALTSSAPSNVRIVGVADSTTSLVMAESTGPVPAGRVTSGTFGAGAYNFPNGFVVAGAASLGAVGVAGTHSFETPVFRQYTGDGTGYAIEFAKRSGSSTTKLVKINETGAPTLEVNGGLNVGGTTDPGDNNLRVEGTTTHVGQTRLADGTYTAPSLAFSNDIDAGFYLNGAGDMRAAVGGADVMAFGAVANIYPHLYLEANLTTNNLGTATTGTDLVISASNAVRPKSSSRRYKENERAWDGDPRVVLRLSPVVFDYKGDGVKNVLFFIAEDVADIDPTFINHNADGQPESIRTDSLVAALIALVQQQERRIAALEARR